MERLFSVVKSGKVTVEKFVKVTVVKCAKFEISTVIVAWNVNDGERVFLTRNRRRRFDFEFELVVSHRIKTSMNFIKNDRRIDVGLRKISAESQTAISTGGDFFVDVAQLWGIKIS